MAIVEVDDQTQRLAVIETVLDERISGHAGNPALNPRVASNAFGSGDSEVLHQPQRFGVRSEVGVKKPMGTGVLVRVSERDLIAEQVLLQKRERVTQTDVVICLRLEAGPHEVRTEHDKQIVGCAGIPGFRGSLLALAEGDSSREKREKGEAHGCFHVIQDRPVRHVWLARIGHHGRASPIGGTDSEQETLITLITRTDSVLPWTLRRIHGSDAILGYEEGIRRMTRELAAVFFAACSLGLAPLLSGDEAASQPGEVSHTETVSFAPGGTIRFDKSFGDLYVEGWDRPEVEMKLIKVLSKVEEDLIRAPEDSYKPPEDTTKRLEGVRFTTAHPSAKELTIATVNPSDGFFRHPLGGKGPVTVRYELRVPRDSSLIIHHGGGNILVGNVTGGVEARNRNGDIVLMLPGPGPYLIDARSKMGSVSCDFAGKAHVRHFVGESFASAGGNSPRRIFLRVGFGGITIKDVPHEAFQ